MERRRLEWIEVTIRGVNRVGVGSEPKLNIVGHDHSCQQDQSQLTLKAAGPRSRGVLVQVLVRTKLQRCPGSRGQCQTTAGVPLSKVLNPQNANVGCTLLSSLSCWDRLQDPPHEPKQERRVKGEEPASVFMLKQHLHFIYPL